MARDPDAMVRRNVAEATFGDDDGLSTVERNPFTFPDIVERLARRDPRAARRDHHRERPFAAVEAA